ncbi:MAG TPA: hypothetical protein VMZ27_17220, partial [Candidatus Saccharimonadales bacterium]|nr:hypothetical protein [Candidatus Saccharimonadales bacterium]
MNPWHFVSRLLLTTLLLTTISTRAANAPLKPLYPGITPACSCESLTNFSLPNTTVDTAVVDTSNRMCRVTVIVTHPPAKDS